jgi:hypothetical protein
VLYGCIPISCVGSSSCSSCCLSRPVLLAESLRILCRATLFCQAAEAWLQCQVDTMSVQLTTPWLPCCMRALTDDVRESAAARCHCRTWVFLGGGCREHASLCCVAQAAAWFVGRCANAAVSLAGCASRMSMPLQVDFAQPSLSVHRQVFTVAAVQLLAAAGSPWIRTVVQNRVHQSKNLAEHDRWCACLYTVVCLRCQMGGTSGRRVCAERSCSLAL